MIDYDKIIKKFRDAHGDTYTYPDLREAPNTKAKITIICPKHGEFTQRLSLHYTSGCKKCGIEKMKASKVSSSSDKVIGKFKELHGDKYNYDKVVYKSMHDKVTITCPEHGDFIQSANNHAHGSICPKCALDNRYDAEELKSDFIQKSVERFPDRFTYDKVDYTDNKIHVTLTCKIHGDFNQRPNDHLASVWGCPKCADENTANALTKTTEDIIERIVETYGVNHGFDLSKLNYTGAHNPITIGCEIHGYFDVYPNNFYKGNGCPKCAIQRGHESRRKSPEDYFREVSEQYNGFYDYSKSVYETLDSELVIGCPTHGDFTKKALAHLHLNVGCPRCARSITKAHGEISDILNQMGYNHKNNCRSTLKDYRELDIVFKDIPLAIEYNGTYWHSSPDKDDQKNKYRHIDKVLECEDMGIGLLHIYEYDWQTDKEKQIQRINHAIDILTGDIHVDMKPIVKCSMDGDHIGLISNGYERIDLEEPTYKIFDKTTRNEVETYEDKAIYIYDSGWGTYNKG